MNEDIQSAFNTAKNVTLTDLERVSMRNHLLGFMSEHPATVPLHIRALDRAMVLFEKSGSFQMRGVFASAFALVMVVGVGSSYAAQGALPGDALYPVKIYFTERVTGAFQTTDAAQANWDTELVSRRLSEAEQLAAKGALTPVARADIQSQIAISTADFNTKVAQLSALSDTAQVAQVQSDLEASLVGHEQVLAALTDNTADGQALAPVLAMVSVHKSLATTARSHAEIAVAHSGAGAKVAAFATKKTMDTAIQAASDAVKNAGTADASAHVAVALAKHTADEGNTHLDQGDYGTAFATFQAASRVAQSTEVNITALSRIGAPLTINATTSATSTVATSTAATSTIEKADEKN